jgi:hypothetical protein
MRGSGTLKIVPQNRMCHTQCEKNTYDLRRTRHLRGVSAKRGDKIKTPLFRWLEFSRRWWRATRTAVLINGTKSIAAHHDTAFAYMNARAALPPGPRAAGSRKPLFPKLKSV